MNIWILQHYATPPDTVSGTRHFNFAKQLIENGYDVTIFACSFNHSTFKEERLQEGEISRIEYIEGVRFLWIRGQSYKRNNWKRMLNMIAYAVRSYMKADSVNTKPTIILASNPHLFSGLTGYFLAKKYQAHFLFEVRDLWPQVFIDVGAFSRWHPLIIFLKMIERFIYQRAELIITLMGGAADYLEECGVNRSKIIYLPHGVNVEMFQDICVELSQEIMDGVISKKAMSKMIVGYVGAHGVADALESLLDCCSILKSRGRRDVHFVLIGHGSEKQRLEKKAIEMCLDNISFYQSIPKKEVPAIIKLFDVAVVSKKDSPLYKFGTSFIKTFDYMACGVPILWSVNSPDCPIRDAHCGIPIPAECPDLMADAVISFADMGDAARKDIGKRGFDYVMDNHDNRVLGQKLEKLFQNLCHKSEMT